MIKNKLLKCYLKQLSLAFSGFLLYLGIVIYVFISFHLSVEVILQLLWFCFATLCDWLRNLAPLYQPIRS